LIGLNALFASIGVMFCLTGAYFAASGFLKTSNKLLIEQARTKWDFNKELFEALVHQRDRAVCGFVFIFIGSLLQFVSLFLGNTLVITLNHTWTIVLSVFAYLFILLLFHWVIKKISSWNIDRTIKEVDF